MEQNSAEFRSIELVEKLARERTLPTRLASAILRFCKEKPLGAAGGFLLLLLTFTAIFAPLIAPYDPIMRVEGAHLAPPSARFLFGGDEIGRDLFSRVVYGARVSLVVGLTVVITAVGTATIVGLVSGYYGGKTDLIIQRFVDTFQAFPGIVLATAIVAVLGTNIVYVIGALGFVLAPSLSRVVRGNVMSIKENTYIEAARAIGSGDLRILFLHILPNVFPIIIILASLELGTAIVLEASLSFLGLGTQPPTPSWGQMLSGTARRYMITHPWLAIFPGLALSLAVFGINLFGDALRDILDPRLRGAGRRG